MELKHHRVDTVYHAGLLLIVPYGIETCRKSSIMGWWNLLIVPYGIETMPPYQHEQAQYLLIVPYGIET